MLGAEISEFLLLPLRNALAGRAESLGPLANTDKIVYLGILDKVISQVQVAFWSSMILSSPLWFFELWRFIKPGLYKSELRAVKPFLFVGFLLFLSGILFGYFLVFPFTFQTLLNFGVTEVEANIGLRDYLVLSSKILVLLGFLFQLPNVMLILGFMGIVTKQSLRKMRRYIYVAFAVGSACLTPPDILTMIGLWFPMVLLFEFGIWAVAFIVHPYLAKQHS
jgi:sec-independent protein translocase protein TatC